ncbi:MAG: hypothetical protein ACRDZ4_08395 [Egibacteraceae bacterium]
MVTPVYPAQHVGHYNVQDGSSSLLQREDLGAPPPHHHHRHRGGGRGRGFGPGWGWGWGYPGPYYEPLYIEDITARKPFILDEEEKEKELKGLAEAASECIQRIVNVAALAARESLEGVKQGIFKSLDDVCAHIRRRVCAEVVAHHKAYAQAVSQAIQVAFESAKPHAEELLAARKAKGVGMSGLSGEVSSQGDYDFLAKVQVRANAILAEISGIGKIEWDQVKDGIFEESGWTPPENYGYENMMAFWVKNAKSIFMTPKKKPTVEQIKEVERLAGGTENLIALVKRFISPEARAKGEADRAATEQALSKGGYKSPEAVGWDTFQSEVESRAGKLLTGGIGIATIGLIAAGLLAAWYFLGGRR